MQELIDMGFNVSDASIVFVKCPVSGMYEPQLNVAHKYEPDDYYSYTIDDILNKLPSDGIYTDESGIQHHIRLVFDNNWRKLIALDYDNDNIYFETTSINTLQSAFEMLKWVRNNF